MNQKIVIILICCLLVLSAGANIYFIQSNAREKMTLQSEIQTMKKANEVLADKINKAKTYANSLDLLFEPARKEGGIPTRRGELNEVKWMNDISNAVKATNDSGLENALNDLFKGNQQAMNTLMYYSAGVIADTLQK